MEPFNLKNAALTGLATSLCMASFFAIAPMAFAQKTPSAEQIVAALDRDKNGTVGLREYVGYRVIRMRQADENGDEKLTVEEYNKTVSPRNHATTAKVFENYDKDGDGMLSMDEYIAINAQIFNTRLDRDRNGELTIDEYKLLTGGR